MNAIRSMHNLSPVGYLILQEDESARQSNGNMRSIGHYFGVDRLPALFPPDDAIREALGEPPIQDVRLKAVIEEWFDSRFANTAFIPDGNRAFRLLKAFHSFGFPFELVHCDLAWTHGEEERLKDYTATDQLPPTVSCTYGFDVSWPRCNHSAIIQPGVVPSNLAWCQKLNLYGLLSDYEDAARLRDEYLLAYPYPPFDIYFVKRCCPK